MAIIEPIAVDTLAGLHVVQGDRDLCQGFHRTAQSMVKLKNPRPNHNLPFYAFQGTFQIRLNLLREVYERVSTRVVCDIQNEPVCCEMKQPTLLADKACAFGLAPEGTIANVKSVCRVDGADIAAVNHHDGLGPIQPTPSASSRTSIK